MSQPGMPQGSMPMQTDHAGNHSSSMSMMSHPASTRHHQVRYANIHKPDHPNLRKDVTNLLNQLIAANGIFNPTLGASIAAVFKADWGPDVELQVFGPGVMQAEYPGGPQTSRKDFPLTFPAGSLPPYNLFPLFNPHGAPGVHAPGDYAVLHPNRQQMLVVACVDVDKVTDLPAPQGGESAEVTITLEKAVQANMQTHSIGPFKLDVQGKLASGQIAQKLLSRLTMMDLATGAVDLRIIAEYKGTGFSAVFGNSQQIGATAPFAVSWTPESSKYLPFLAMDGSGRTVGGINVSYRFVRDSAALHQELPANKQQQSWIAPKSSTAKNNLANDDELSIWPPTVCGQSGKFSARDESGKQDPKGAQSEILEMACLALEGQNRALLQKTNIAHSAKQMFERQQKKAEKKEAKTWRLPNGYRDWDGLDGVFMTLGPNYVAQSTEIGVPICRVYEDNTSISKELRQKPGFGAGDTPQEKAVQKMMIKTLFNGDPDHIFQNLRPVGCKNANTIDPNELDIENRTHSLSVRVHSAMNFRTKQNFLTGPVEPKVIVDVPARGAERGPTQDGQFRFETSPAPDGIHVEWNQGGVIQNYNRGDDIRVRVVDKDWIGWDDHLGEARLPFVDFRESEGGQPYLTELPLFNGDRTKSNAPGNQKGGGATISIEVRIISPDERVDAWPPDPPKYAPMWNVNVSDQEIQRLANWDITQNAKLPFDDVSTNYNKFEDIWGAIETQKAIEEGDKNPRIVRSGSRVKDECLMA